MDSNEGRSVNAVDRGGGVGVDTVGDEETDFGFNPPHTDRVFWVGRSAVGYGVEVVSMDG